MPDRAVLVQLSDPHLRIGEIGPAAALERAVARVAALRPVPVAVIVTGDIANGGAAEEYAQAAALLGVLEIPVHVIPGNHDDRSAMRAAFGQAGAVDAPVQYAFDAGPLRLIACDTLVPGADTGRLDVAWLADQLTAEPGRPTVVAMHHPPIDIGVSALDAISIPADERAAFAALLAGSPQVLAVIAGHVHRAATGSLGGVPVITAPGTDQQLALDMVGDALATSADPPGFLIHVRTAGGLVSHVQNL